MASAARRQIIGGGAPAHGSTLLYVYELNRVTRVTLII